MEAEVAQQVNVISATLRVRHLRLGRPYTQYVLFTANSLYVYAFKYGY